METSNGKFVGVAAVAIAIVALGISFFGGSSQPSQNVGGERAGLQEFIDGIKAGDINAKWVSAKLPTQENSVLIYANRTGHDVIADFGSMVIPTGETASSTSLVSIFATTSSSIAASNNFATISEISRALIQAATVATSSTATTTNSINSAALGQGIGAIVVPTGSFIFGYLQQNVSGCSVAAAGKCETATSSARGFNPIFNVRVHAVLPGAPSL